MTTDMCCCCLTEGFHYKNMDFKYNYSGQVDIYKNILQDTFNITISHQQSSLICEECITRLRDAFNFKIQVRRSLSQICERVERINKAKENLEDKVNIPNANKAINSKKTKPRHLKSSNKRKTDSIKKQNTIKLIRNSNMCLFKYNKEKYKCYCCTESYMTVVELRDHMITNHTTKEIELKIQKQINVDQITADASKLQCDLCKDSCENLQQLQIHLNTKHGVKFTGDADENNLVTFRLENGMKCEKCNIEYLTFRKLYHHCNEHYKNFLCHVCGLTFMKRSKLNSHNTYRHSQKCRECNEAFATAYEKMRHKNKVHNVNYKRKCKECNTEFKNHHALTTHVENVHGSARPKSSCPICNKTFVRRNNIEAHIRNVHRQEKRYSCGTCNRQFFNKYDMERHVKSHDDSQKFPCDYCTKLLKSRESRKKHLRTVHTDAPR